MMDVKELLLLLRDFFIMIVHVSMTMMCELYQLIIPPPEKNIRDQLVLVSQYK